MAKKDDPAKDLFEAFETAEAADKPDTSEKPEASTKKSFKAEIVTMSDDELLEMVGLNRDWLLNAISRVGVKSRKTFTREKAKELGQVVIANIVRTSVRS